MTALTFTVQQSGERLDALLARSVEGLTRSAAQRLLEDGAVTCRGKALKKNDRPAAGDVVEVLLPDPEPVDVLPQNIPLDVVYEDEDVIVVNKPVGMVVHPAPGHPDGTLVNALLFHCGDTLSGINGTLRPGIVHRIDRDTSGLIIAAKERPGPSGFGRPASGPLPGPGVRGGGGGQLPGGRRHGGRPHRPAPGGPQADGGGTPNRPSRCDPLVRAGQVPGLYPCGVPPGDRAHPPDPGPSGLYRPPAPWRHGVWQPEALARPGRPVPPRPALEIHPPLHRPPGGTGMSSARLVPGSLAQVGGSITLMAGSRQKSPSVSTQQNRSTVRCLLSAGGGPFSGSTHSAYPAISCGYYILFPKNYRRRNYIDESNRHCKTD